MKILQILVLFVLFTSFAKAQACGSIFLRIYLKNSKGQNIKNAKIETFDKEFKDKTFPFDRKISWSDEHQAYLGFQALGGAHYQTGFRISAEGFENLEKVIDLKFGWQPYEITLKTENSNEIPTITKLTRVFGQINDLAGQGVPKVRIAVFDQEKTIFSSVSDLKGYYELFLPIGKYDLKFSADGFKSSLYEKINITENKNKELNLNLEVGDIETLPNITNNKRKNNK